MSSSFSGFSYEGINRYQGTRSPAGTYEYDMTTAYFFRSLYMRAFGNLHFTLQEGWNPRYVKNVLFDRGFLPIIVTSAYGIIPQAGTLSGFGLYYDPREVHVKNELVDFDGVIGKDCELIRLTPDYSGICDVIEHYAIQLSTIYTSIQMSLKNSRLAFILVGKNKAAKLTLKAIAEAISAGETTVVVDQEIKQEIDGADPIWTAAFNPKESYITDQLLADMRTILNAYDREVGIPVVDQKKERMITDEVSTQISDAGARADAWRECLQESIDNVNRLFDLSISFTLGGGDSNVKDGQGDLDGSLPV